MDVLRTLKALADPVRLRILGVLAQEELTVGEVQEIVETAQSSVSRHLAILREAGLVQARREGTNVHFSLSRDMPARARALFDSLSPQLSELPEAKHDRARLDACRERRMSRLHGYFEALAGDWDRIRKNYFDDRVTAIAIEKLLPPGLVVADIGCGTGSLALELARLARRVIAVDLSQEMLRRAREGAEQARVANIDFRYGNALDLPVDSRSVDAAFCVMVLHFLDDPGLAVRELCRITRPGGSVIVLDLVEHDQAWMREQMAHCWLGFGRETIEGWFHQGGAEQIDYEPTGSYAGARMARNGNRPVEIFVARALLPSKPDDPQENPTHERD